MLAISRGGGFRFASSIESDADIFWCPHRYPRVLLMSAERATGPADKETLDISALPCRTLVLLTAAGFQNVLFTDAGRSLQLAVSGEDLLGSARLASNVLWPPREVKHRLDALACLNALRSTGRLLPRFFPVEPRRARLRWVLQALDGSIAGASHREIGQALFGKARIERDWVDPGDHLRDMIRRAIKRGRLLMDGGYKRFLL